MKTFIKTYSYNDAIPVEDYENINSSELKIIVFKNNDPHKNLLLYGEGTECKISTSTTPEERKTSIAGEQYDVDCKLNGGRSFAVHFEEGQDTDLAPTSATPGHYVKTNDDINKFHSNLRALLVAPSVEPGNSTPVPSTPEVPKDIAYEWQGLSNNSKIITVSDKSQQFFVDKGIIYAKPSFTTVELNNDAIRFATSGNLNLKFTKGELYYSYECGTVQGKETVTVYVNDYNVGTFTVEVEAASSPSPGPSGSPDPSPDPSQDPTTPHPAEGAQLTWIDSQKNSRSYELNETGYTGTINQGKITWYENETPFVLPFDHANLSYRVEGNLEIDFKKLNNGYVQWTITKPKVGSATIRAYWYNIPVVNGTFTITITQKVIEETSEYYWENCNANNNTIWKTDEPKPIEISEGEIKAISSTNGTEIGLEDTKLSFKKIDGDIDVEFGYSTGYHTYLCGNKVGSANIQAYYANTPIDHGNFVVTVVEKPIDIQYVWQGIEKNNRSVPKKNGNLMFAVKEGEIKDLLTGQEILKTADIVEYESDGPLGIDIFKPSKGSTPTYKYEGEDTGTETINVTVNGQSVGSFVIEVYDGNWNIDPSPTPSSSPTPTPQPETGSSVPPSTDSKYFWENASLNSKSYTAGVDAKGYVDAGEIKPIESGVEHILINDKGLSFIRTNGDAAIDIKLGNAGYYEYEIPNKVGFATMQAVYDNTIIKDGVFTITIKEKSINESSAPSVQYEWIDIEKNTIKIPQPTIDTIVEVNKGTPAVKGGSTISKTSDLITFTYAGQLTLEQTKQSDCHGIRIKANQLGKSTVTAFIDKQPVGEFTIETYKNDSTNSTEMPEEDKGSTTIDPSSHP